MKTKTNIFIIILLMISLITSILPNSLAVVGVNYTASSSKIYKNGVEIKMKGINYFGFETSDLTIHGLWARNWKSMIQQIKSTGFNAVRLPFCPKTLKPNAVSSIDYSKNTDLQGLNSIQIFDKVIDELNNNQIYILLDHHRPDCNAISEKWYTPSYSENQWINDLRFVAKRYANKEYFFGLDLKNEPHDSASWGTGNKAADWNLAAERAGKAVLYTNPNILIFVEGISQNPSCISTTETYWGGNFEPYNCKPMNYSFIPKNKLVFSPHVYGPDVYLHSYHNSPSYPSNMFSIWDTHFGFLHTVKNENVVIGEFGGMYGTGNPKDIQYQDTLVEYLKARKMCNSFYWTWNANSGDTNGILNLDWQTINTSKMTLLNKLYTECN